MREHITEQDLLNIGLSKNYVKSIVARIKEYNDNTKKKNKNNGQNRPKKHAQQRAKRTKKNDTGRVEFQG